MDDEDEVTRLGVGRKSSIWTTERSGEIQTISSKPVGMIF